MSDCRPGDQDRWLIVAYIRALQLTQMAKTADAADDHKRLEGGGRRCRQGAWRAVVRHS
jgi:hypothetical protein